jgi:hypothetical protein
MHGFSETAAEKLREKVPSDGDPVVGFHSQTSAKAFPVVMSQPPASTVTPRTGSGDPCYGMAVARDSLSLRAVSAGSAS